MSLSQAEAAATPPFWSAEIAGMGRDEIALDGSALGVGHPTSLGYNGANRSQRLDSGRFLRRVLRL